MEEKDASFGHFGCESVPSDTNTYVIPYIYRQNVKLVSLNIFRAFLFHYNIKLEDLPKSFKSIDKLKMSKEEAKLINEINIVHNDSYYPHTFNVNEELVQVKDVQDIAQYLLLQHKKC